MGKNTSISWCDHTFNPWRGCTKVSAGCANCYAEKLSHRNPGVLGVWGDHGTRVVAGEAMWQEPHKWARAAAEAGERRRVFCASLGDVFEDRPELAAPRRRLVDTIWATPSLDWLLLTKRPENAGRMLYEMFAVYDVPPGAAVAAALAMCMWPRNYWLGTSVENQDAANERIPHLLRTPAPIRFLSVEPMLGPIEISQYLRGSLNAPDKRGGHCLPGDPERGIGDRSPGESMESRGPSLESMESVDKDNSLRKTPSGAPVWSVSPGPSDDGQHSDQRLGSQAGLETFSRTDSRGTDGQSRERSQDGQSPRQSDACDISTTDDPRNSSSWPNEPGRRTQSSISAYERIDCVDQREAAVRGETQNNRGRLRSQRQDYIEDLANGTMGISWVIVGGESGPGSRAAEATWISSLVEQCAHASIPCFVKQMGSQFAKKHGCKDPKGGDPSEWPEHLRVRQFPRLDGGRA